MENFISFLSNHKADKVKKNWTHWSSGEPKGAYNINTDDYDEFFKLYSSVKDKDTYIIEQCPPDACSLRIDLDFKIKSSIAKPHYYNKENIKTFVMSIITYINSIIKIEKNTQCFIMEKEYAQYDKNNDIYKDGIHIIFPHIVIEYMAQYWIRDQVLAHNLIPNCFGNMGYVNIPSDIYDKGIIEKCWTMYWSKGKTGGQVYRITDIYIFNDTSSIKKTIKESDIDTNNIARYLSILNNRKKLEYQETKEDEIRNWYYDKFVKNKNIYKNFDNELTTLEDLEVAKKLVKILKKSRAENYEDWTRVCWCLRNIHSEKMLQDFLEFSKNCPEKFDESKCIELWNKADESGKLRIGTLHYWAKNDSLEEYKTIMETTTTSMFEKLPDTHYSIALIMKKLYGYDFVCCYPMRSVESRDWYHFENHRWSKNGYATIRKRLSGEINDYYKRIKSRLTNKTAVCIGDDADPDVVAEYQKKIKHIDKIIKNLETSRFIDDVIKEAGYQMENPDFLNILDSNGNLLGFNNGIYDLKHTTFREGYPEDYVSMSVGYDFALTKTGIDEVKEFIYSILPCKDVQKYALYFMSTCLDGFNHQQKFLVFTGEGGNGKSLLVSLLEETLGEYASPLDVALITQKRQKSSAASPEIVCLMNKRLAILAEPNKEDTINMGIVKALTGSDKIKARGLYKEGVDFRNNAQLLMMSNDLPPPNSQDDGVWRRIRVIHFPMKFVDIPDPNDSLQKKKDYELEEKIKNWKLAFMNLLLAYYRKYKNENYRINEPSQVLEYTDNYQKQSNIYLEFDKENLIKSLENDKIKIGDIYTVFKQWFKDNYPSTLVPPMKNLKGYYATKYKSIFNKDILHNMKFKN